MTRKSPDPLKVFDLMLPAVTWAAWRTFTKAICGVPLDDSELALYKTCTGRLALPTTAGHIVRRIVGIIGRRGGKTRVIAWLASYLAAFIDYSDVLAPGETGVVVCMAPSRMQAQIAKGYIEAFFDAHEVLQQMVTRRTNDAIELRTSKGQTISIMIVSASFKLSRGFTAVAFIGDESAFWETDSSAANPDKEIYRAVEPSLATTGGPAILITTPYAPTGLVHELYEKHWGKDASDTLVWVADSLTMNPALDKKIVDRAYDDDPESASAEYGARFRADLAPLFDPAVLQSCISLGRRELPPAAGVIYSAFADMAGGSGGDSSVIAISHREAVTGRVILDVLREWKSPHDPAVVVREAKALLTQYGCKQLTGDKYAAFWVVSAFAAESIEYIHCEQTRSELYLEALPLLNSGSVELLDNSRLLSQFIGLRRRTGSSGRDTVDHKPGAHDDLSNAVSGALRLATQGSGKLRLPDAFRLCYREVNRLYVGNGCYLMGGRFKPTRDAICSECVGLRFVRAARAAHEKKTGEAIHDVQFFRDRCELPEALRWRLFREASNRWADAQGI